MTSEVTSPNPVGGAIQPGSWRKAGTQWLSVGKDTGGRTSGIAVTARARVLTHERVPKARAANPRTGRRPTKVTAGKNPRNGLCVRYSKQLLLNIASAVELALQRTFTVWEVGVRSWLSCPAACRRLCVYQLLVPRFHVSVLQDYVCGRSLDGGLGKS